MISMKKWIAYSLLSLTTGTVSQSLMANPITEGLLNKYRAEGAATFSVENGKQAWTKEMPDKKGVMHSCASCHGNDLTQVGEHPATHKAIKPMAPSLNTKRLTDERKIEKWLTRNCKWTWGRECTAQEKGDFLVYLLAQ